MFFKKEKEYDYFDYFTRTAAFACEAAACLHESLADFNEDLFRSRMAKMHEIENRADDEKHEMMTRLSHEFITPIEREDIVALAQHLDDVVDSIDDVMLRIDMYCLTEIRPEALAFTDLIIKCCQELHKAVGAFRSFKSSTALRDGIRLINSIESEGDKLHSDCVRTLFRSPAIDAKTVIAWSGIYEDLEVCLDACEHSTDVMESVMMKNT